MPKFVPRQRKHKVLARQNAAGNGGFSTTSSSDANASQIIPLSKDEKEVKRQKLRDELRAGQPKMSAKKQKRLDKYIENKLKKDENIDLIRKLENEKEKWDARGLLSSKNLKKRGFDEFVSGQVGVVSSHEVTIPKPYVKKDRQDQDQNIDKEEEEDVASEDSFEAEHQEAFDEKYAPESDETWAAKRAPPVQGSGLAQPLQLGPDGLPMIQMRAGQRKRKRTQESVPDISLDLVSVELPWEGFDSEPDEIGGTIDSEDDYGSEPGSDEEVESEDSDEYYSEEEDSEVDMQSDASTSATSQEQVKIKPRASAFKAWATQQLNQAIGHTPSYAQNGEGELPVPKEQSERLIVTKQATQESINLINGLPEVKAPTMDRRIYSVQVQRPEALQESRVQLPILQREQEIMEAIHANAVVVIKGDTGSGKTTQLPQFLYEAGYGDPNGPTPGMIGITQPRRVAAVSMAKRVGEELGDHGGRVAHQIRFDSSVSSKTAIKFMTDGILLRELSQDLLLKKYSAIIIDEAHERSVNTDILIGMLSKIVPARMRKDRFNPNPQPLKLIIMSATLNIEDFLHDKLFAPSLRPPVVEAEGRQHRVTTHFALRSRADYLEEIIEKVKRAHRKLPKGGMLVFLTGQMEIKQVQARLRKELKQSNTENSPNIRQSKMHVAASETPLEVEDIDFGLVKTQYAEDEDEIDILTHSDEEAEEREFEISDDDEEENDDGATRTNGYTQKNDKKDPYDSIHVLPLYSQLPTKEQLRVFDPPPERSRLIVLATNVAETSLTIPGIRYVFDCGRSKERKFDLNTGVQSFEIDYISKASSQQRAGRAGRTGPGHCWRLYTSAVYEQYFPNHTEPEILRAPAESVVLQIKGFAYPKPVVEFPFPTAPTLQTIDKAEKLLKNLGALTAAGVVTDLGKELSNYPLSPRLGKMLASAVMHKEVLANAISLVAGLAVGDIYVNNAAAFNQDDDDDYQKDEHDQLKQKYGRVQATLSKQDKTSDALRMVTAVSMYIEASDKESFCDEYFLKPKAMNEIAQLVHQLRSIISANHSGITIPSPASTSLKHNPKSKSSIALVKLTNITAASGYIDQVAIRWDCAPNPPTLPTKPRRAIDVPYLPLIPLQTSSTGLSDITTKAIFIHPSSLLSRLPTKDLPQYITYTHLQQSQSRTISTSPSAGTTMKTRMHPLTPVDAASLATLAHGTALLEYGKPIPKMKVEELPGTPKRRVCWVSSELRGTTAGGYGWPMPAVKVQQVLDLRSSSGWRVEEVLS